MPALMHNILAISRCSTAYRQPILAPLGIKPMHASYLICICRNPGITQDQLSKKLFLDKSSVARQISFLEENGFINRQGSETDRRVMHVYPTQKAIDALPEVRKSFRDWENLVSEGLTDEERDVLVSLLEKLKQRASEWMEG